MEEIENLLSRVGGHVTRDGYRYIVYILALILSMDYFPHRMFTKYVYPAAANHFQVPAANVTKAVYRAVKDCWDYGDHTALEEVAGRRLLAKPTPEELFYFCSRYLKKQAQGRVEIKA